MEVVRSDEHTIEQILFINRECAITECVIVGERAECMCIYIHTNPSLMTLPKGYAEIMRLQSEA